PARQITAEPTRVGADHDPCRASHREPELPLTSRSTAIFQHMPPSRYPAPSPVIQASTMADLPNRQGPCLRNSSAHTGPAACKRPFPAAAASAVKLDIHAQK